MMSETDQVLAIPLWINGRAYLTMAPAFFDARDAASGEIKRRTPLCGASEALAAATSAQAALPDWAARSVAERAALLLALADALAGYGEHFAALISEESGKDAALAAAEVGGALGLYVLATGIFGFFSWRFTRFVIDDRQVRIEHNFIQHNSDKVPFTQTQSAVVVLAFAARSLGLAQQRIDVGSGAGKTIGSSVAG